jgi:formamidopyrimidine-DNA glycosylase
MYAKTYQMEFNLSEEHLMIRQAARDFAQTDGNPGYFQQHLFVYGKAGKECERCSATIKSEFIGQRNSFYCPKCQS